MEWRRKKKDKVSTTYGVQAKFWGGFRMEYTFNRSHIQLKRFRNSFMIKE